MTQDEIIRMAREAGMKIYKGGTVKVGDGVVKTKSVISTDLNELERFAALVAAHEKKLWMAQIEVECNEAVLAERDKQAEPKCSPHPDAPHGFDRNASHSANRYVCECDGWEPEQVEQEPMMDYERINALREGEQNGAEDAYFFVRPENDTPSLRKMFCQGFERGFHKGLKYASPVQQVDLTDDEIMKAVISAPKERSIRTNQINEARAVIAADREKNRA